MLNHNLTLTHTTDLIPNQEVKDNMTGHHEGHEGHGATKWSPADNKHTHVQRCTDAIKSTCEHSAGAARLKSGVDLLTAG